MPIQKELNLCYKCESELYGDFCAQCGHPQQLPKINGKYILLEIGKVLNFDKGILYTIKELLLRPGESVQEFIHKDRNRLVKPIIFLIICSLIYTLAQQILQFEDGYINASGLEQSTTASIFTWIQNNYGYANLIMSLFIVFWIKILFRKYAYNFFEILILLLFVMGVGMLIYTTFGIIESSTNLKVLHFGGIIGFVYAAWAIGAFFDKSKKINYFKGIVAYILGFASFGFSAIALGNLIDFILK